MSSDSDDDFDWEALIKAEKEQRILGAKDNEEHVSQPRNTGFSQEEQELYDKLQKAHDLNRETSTQLQTAFGENSILRSNLKRQSESLKREVDEWKARYESLKATREAELKSSRSEIERLRSERLIQKQEIKEVGEQIRSLKNARSATSSPQNSPRKNSPSKSGNLLDTSPVKKRQRFDIEADFKDGFETTFSRKVPSFKQRLESAASKNLTTAVNGADQGSSPVIMLDVSSLKDELPIEHSYWNSEISKSLFKTKGELMNTLLDSTKLKMSQDLINMKPLLALTTALKISWEKRELLDCVTITFLINEVIYLGDTLFDGSFLFDVKSLTTTLRNIVNVCLETEVVNTMFWRKPSKEKMSLFAYKPPHSRATYENTLYCRVALAALNCYKVLASRTSPVVYEALFGDSFFDNMWAKISQTCSHYVHLFVLTLCYSVSGSHIAGYSASERAQDIDKVINCMVMQLESPVDNLCHCDIEIAMTGNQIDLQEIPDSKHDYVIGSDLHVPSAIVQFLTICYARIGRWTYRDYTGQTVMEKMGFEMQLCIQYPYKQRLQLVEDCMKLMVAVWKDGLFKVSHEQIVIFAYILFSEGSQLYGYEDGKLMNFSENAIVLAREIVEQSCTMEEAEEIYNYMGAGHNAMAD